MRNILIDCDPGVDDLAAILLACAFEELRLLGVTAVAGNQIVEKTCRNASRALTLAGRSDIPVARGLGRPLVRPLHVPPDAESLFSLDGAGLPEPVVEPLQVHAVDFIIQALRESAEPVTLVPIGPLTNIALVLLKDPEIGRKIERIVLMGGAVYDSNITPAAEFNIFVDPEAADLVFRSGLPITMVGLDVTHRALLTFGDLDHLEETGGRVSRTVASMLRAFARAQQEIFPLDGLPLHDALAVASLVRPEVIETRSLNVAVETRGELTRGRTVVDMYGVTGRAANAEVALEVDTDLFRRLVIEGLHRLDVTASR